MEASPQQSRVEFPRFSFVCTAVLTLLAIGILGHSSLRSLKTIQGLEQNEIAIERACGLITYYDEVLTMSARMAASTGNLKWERRYHEHVPLLDQAMDEAYFLAPVAEELAGTEQTQEANRELVRMELEALDSVRRGELEEAGAVLTSSAYERFKRIYSASNKLYITSMRARVSNILESERMRAVWEQGALLVLVPLLVLFWFHVGRAVKRHIAQREIDEAIERSQSEELQAKNAEVREALRVKSEFLSRMSHEIRTPMNGVLGIAEVLSHTKLDVEQAEYVNTIVSSGDMLQSIVNDILDYSKIEAGMLAILPVPCDPRNLVREVAGLLSQRALEKGIEVRSHVEPEVAASVALDPVRVRQILLNLLGNGVKFTSEGYVELHLAPGPSPLTLLFTVRDTGPGIRSDRLQKIFESFAQADGSIESRYGGTGLGLTISRELSRMMGGDVSVESEVGEGTTFSVVLPAIPVQLADGNVPKPDDTPQQWNARVLVAEDNTVNQLVSRRMLERYGLQVDIVNNGQEALDAVEATPEGYDLVFMDLGMPVLDGLKATRAIRAQETPQTRLPIVALTASAFPGDLDACRDADMDGFVNKPIRKKELRTVLERWLGPSPALPSEPAKQPSEVCSAESDPVHRADVVAEG